MEFFFGDGKIDYSKPDQYAYLNWRFDSHSTEVGQRIFGNYEMGQAHLSNAVLSLFSIIRTNNTGSIADALIFPILFNVWHGIELLLKSGITAVDVLKPRDINPITKCKGHDIIKLTTMFKSQLERLGLEETSKSYLIPLNDLILGFQKVNAHFDFARYPTDTRGNMQFYNAPYGNDKQWQSKNRKPSTDENATPNTCVRIFSLFQLLCDVLLTFSDVVYYLTTCISENEDPSDQDYFQFRKISENFDELLNEASRQILSDEEALKKFMDLLSSKFSL